MVKVRSDTGGKAKWTVIVYMTGDNNLDGAALIDKNFLIHGESIRRRILYVKRILATSAIQTLMWCWRVSDGVEALRIVTVMVMGGQI